MASLFRPSFTDKKTGKLRKTKKWYAKNVPGHTRPVPLSANKAAAQIMLSELVRRGELARVGVEDQHETHRKRPLAEHLAEWEAVLRTGAKDKHVRQTVACAQRVLDGCGFVFMADLSAPRVQWFLGTLREHGRTVQPLDPAKEWYTKRELAEALGVKPHSIPSLVRQHRLDAEGNGKARRYPRATADDLRDRRTRGRSVKTTNLHLDAIKQFVAWMVQDRRMPAEENTIAHLSGGNVKTDRRHDRQTLAPEQLGAVLAAARASDQTFRGLDGRDRHALYLCAMGTGFRASELASLDPEAFALDSVPPTAIVAATNTKNGITAEQPLPPDVVDCLRSYLIGRPSKVPVWPGTWCEDAAEMLRIDLDTADIAYVVQGPNGPLFADFHSLRHSYIALLDRSGATLKEAMALARHSDPKLTMAVYGRAQLHDLGSRVRGLLSAVQTFDKPDAGEWRATGTDDSACTAACPLLALSGDSDRGRERTGDDVMGELPPSGENRNPLRVNTFDEPRGAVRTGDESSPSRTRTYNKPVNSRLLYH